MTRPGVSKAAGPGPASPPPAGPPLARPLLTASLMILVMTALGRFRSSGLSAIAAAGGRASAPGFLFRTLRRPDFPRRHGLTQLGFRPAPRCPHYPTVPRGHILPPPPAPSYSPPVVGESRLSKPLWFWPAETSVRPHQHPAVRPRLVSLLHAITSPFSPN